jgi:hypothetical protein
MGRDQPNRKQTLRTMEDRPIEERGVSEPGLEIQLKPFAHDLPEDTVLNLVHWLDPTLHPGFGRRRRQEKIEVREKM